jgi:RNA recognition motif-containing protein
VISARVIMDRATGKSRGFGIVEFAKEEQAAEAIRALHNQPLRSRSMRVNDADDRPPKREAPAMPPVTSFSGFDTPSSDFGGGGGDDPRKFNRAKGSRRGLRRRKRSL